MPYVVHQPETHASSLLKERRKYLRIKAAIPVELMPEEAAAATHAQTADISVGGLCLLGEPSGVPLEAGQSLPGCRIVLPDMGTVTTDLVVRNSYTVTLKNGAKSRRTGCEFSRLGSQQEAMIQRYIMKLDRERRLK